MAINIYGSCNGNSENKYDLWLNVMQNSQSLEENTSNVTVKLCLKRNDGVASSVYNPDESSNTVVLKVAGSERVNKNLAIDTRNNTTVTLAIWTGDVSHEADGTLSLSVSGSFTMDNSHLTGGSVTGNFDCTGIPRISGLTLSATSLYPEDTVGARLESASAEFNHRIKWSIGTSSVVHALSEGVEQDVFTVPVSWAEEITKSSSGIISVVLTTYKGTKKIGSKSYSLKLVIPKTDEFLPEFGIIAKRTDDSVSMGSDEYVKGKSSIILDADALTLKHGAKAVSYTVKVGSATKKEIPATFDLPYAGEFTASITVKDSRGFSVTKSQKINVLEYTAPTVSVKSLYRCDKDGSKNTSGGYALVDLVSHISSLNGKNSSRITYRFRKSGESDYSDEYEIDNNPCILGEGLLLSNASYVMEFRITDLITSDGDCIEFTVPGADIPFNIRRGGKGAAFGCYAEKDNELTVAWNMNVKGDLCYENAEAVLSSAVTDKKGVARYIPCLQLVVIRLCFTANQAIASGASQVVATLSKIPTLFTPINVNINQSAENVARGGIKAETGELVISADKTINAGDNIYVSGVYFANRT